MTFDTTNSAPLTLAIDCAADAASLALLRGDEVIATHEWTATSNMSLELLAAIAEFVSSAGVERDAIEQIAVNVGPGQYGALRTGVATAQGLALALGVPLAGIGRFEADVLPHLSPEGASARPVVAVHEAGRSGIAWGAYLPGEAGLPAILTEPRLDPVEELPEKVPADALWCGEVTEALIEVVRPELAPPAEQPRAVSLARIAIAREAFGDPAGVDAVYLRPPPITQPRV